ncbi:hypothetical protein NYG95_04590 [Campylobacter felis]|uniref:Uncharacterized protein n=1 Tax=Campylobacter felis TaxID=2974565 RepID=A0ABT7I3P0_9BACT|nr:hypothetical protein [Campylobacter upsaliensis]MDL0108418.1 hypothetical protein [Campylobacter felis]MDL0146922.1 hypothetical protein [Campylobacter felis]
MKFKKRFIALENFKINQNFQVFVEKLNKRQTSQNQRKNTGGQGSCALQAYEIYYQMLHNQNAFKSVKYHFIEKEGFLDENIKEKRAHIAFHMQNYIPYKTLFFTMYDFLFLRARFLKTSNLRALLEREEFFKVPILCNITSKAGAGHINILYRDEKGLFVINTNENSKNKIKLIEPHNGDIFAFEEIAYNWIGEFEDVKDFRLYIPYENIELEEKKEEIEEDFKEEEFEEDFEEEDLNEEFEEPLKEKFTDEEKEQRKRELEKKYGLDLSDYDFMHEDFERALKSYKIACLSFFANEKNAKIKFLGTFMNPEKMSEKDLKKLEKYISDENEGKNVMFGGMSFLTYVVAFIIIIMAFKGLIFALR